MCKKKFNTWVILVPAALLLGISLWILPQQMVHKCSQTWVKFKPLYAIRQGLVGFLALVMAFGIGRYLSVRQVLRLWWVPLALLGIAVLFVPLSLWAEWGFLIEGSYWWQRTPGLIVIYLAMLGGLVYAVPRFARGERGGWLAFVGLMVYAVVMPLIGIGQLIPLFILPGMLGLCLLCAVRGKRFWIGLASMVLIVMMTAIVLVLTRPRLVEHCVYPDKYSASHLQQSLFSIHCGGLTGGGNHMAMLSDAHTDFIFSRLCGKGGLLLGSTVLLIMCVLLIFAWRIVGRQRDLRARTLAAGCAGLLTAGSLLHVAVNVGWFPTVPVLFPFLSYGPLLLMMDGVLLGLLMALDGSCATDEGEPLPRWPTNVILAAMGLLFLVLVVILFKLVYAAPELAQLRAVS